MLSIETCCILPDPRYVCTVATLPNLRRLRVTSDAVSKVLHLIDVPSFTSIEIARSLDGTRDVTVLLTTDVMSVEMRNYHGGVITIAVKDIPIGAYGLDDVMPPRYSALLINTSDSMFQLTSLESISSLSIVVHEEAQSILFYTAVEGSPAQNGAACCKTSKTRRLWLYLSLRPASHVGGHPFFVDFHDDVPEIEAIFRHHGHSGQ